MLEIIIFVIGFLADRIAKIMTMLKLQPGGVGTSVVIIPDVLSFTYVENTGAAHGLFHDMVWMLIPLSVLVCAGLVWFLVKNRKKSGLMMRVGIALILAGAFGNMFDRIFYGYVIDMIEVTFISYPVFNPADNMVVIGTALFAFYILFLDKTVFVSHKKTAVTEISSTVDSVPAVEDEDITATVVTDSDCDTDRDNG